jgi:hypothetical protein
MAADFPKDMIDLVMSFTDGFAPPPAGASGVAQD